MFFLIKFSALVKTDFIFKFYFKSIFKYLSIYIFVSNWKFNSWRPRPR